MPWRARREGASGDGPLGRSEERPTENWRLHALFLRVMITYREQLVRLDPWVPVPQSGTCYAFGDGKLPLPIGALAHLWKHCPEFLSLCTSCKVGTAYGYCFGGLLSIGGIHQICAGCGEPAFNRYGGLARILNLVEPILADTSFYMNGIRFGGAFVGGRRPLVEALRKLGWEAEIPERWLADRDTSIFSFGRRGKPQQRFYFGS